MLRLDHWWLVLAIAWLGLVVTGSLAAHFAADPLAVDLSARFASPSSSHWLGTDELGRDTFARLLVSVQRTALICCGATVLALALGLVLGAVAAWFGGGVDKAVLLLINLFWSVPVAVFAILIVAVTDSRALALVCVIAGVNWVVSARVFRTNIIQVRRSEFVRFARSLGFSSPMIIGMHVTPHLRLVGLTLAGYALAETVALESGLAFLGLSLPPPNPTWGGMIADGLPYLSHAPCIAAAPALMLTLTMISLRTLISRSAVRSPIG
jgi:peptide/nickel transport system permease protein